MSEDLSIQGTLAETTVPDLMRSLIRSGETAVISLEAIGRHDMIFFNVGRIAYATSSDPDLGLAEILLRTGELNLLDYNEASEKVVGTKRVGAVLCELGYLKPDELIRAEERQVSGIALNAMSYRTGSYTIDFREEFPKDVVALPLNTERLVLDGVSRIDYWSLVARGIGRMSRLLRHVPDADARIFNLDLTEEESHIYSLLGQQQTVEALCGRSYLSNFVTCRTAWALLSANLLEEGESSEMAERRATVESELELETIVETYNESFQNIYALVYQKIGDGTWHFVERVVEHLSPESQPYLSGISLTNEGRVDFDQLLNNLIAAGSSDHRQAVNDLMSGLLYGWILEIRQEFGADLESDVNRIVGPLREQ